MITIGQLRSRLQELGPEYDHTDVIVEVYDEEMKLDRVGECLAQNGCDCDCGHDSGGHDDDCDRCLACRVDTAMRNQ